MNRMWIVAHRVGGFFTARRHDARLSDEIRCHLDSLTEQYLSEGLSLENARNAARRDFGGVAHMVDTYRDQRGLPVLDALTQDLRYACRTFARAPGFTFVVVLTLALGIGANTAIFSVLNALLLRSLPVPNPEELFVAVQHSPTLVQQRVSFPMFEALRDAASPSAALAAVTQAFGLPVVIERGAPERATVQLVSGEYFGTLGLAPALGRLLTPDDTRTMPGAAVGVLSHRFWRLRFGATPDVLGRTLLINGAHLTVAGVAPAEFSGEWLESATDIWIPATMQHDIRYRTNYSGQSDADPGRPWVPQDNLAWVRVIGRAHHSARDRVAAMLGVLFQERLSHLAGAVESADGKRYLLDQRLTLEPFATGFSVQRDRLRTPLLALLATVTLTLLIACANTANLLLARAATRRREMAIRLSMGAARGRLVRQLLTESSLIGAAAATLGVLLAWTVAPALGARLVASPPGAPVFAVPLDARVLAYTAVVSIATVLLFGVSAAFRTTRVDLGTTLRLDARTMRGGSQFGAPRILVAFQVAVSLVLVAGAVLFARSFRNLTRVDLGFSPDSVISAALNPRAVQYPVSELPGLYRRVVERVEQLPQVRSAAVAECLLATNCHHNNGLRVRGYQPRAGEQVRIEENHVSAGYFSTVGMRLVAGRDFNDRDGERAPKVAIVNEALARRFLAKGRAVGARLAYENQDIEIVGVVQDAHLTSVREQPFPMAYIPIDQQASPVYATGVEIVVSGEPRRMAAEVRKAIAEVAPELPIERVWPLSDQVSRNIDQDRLVAMLSTIFGLLGLGLASFGLFGVISHDVARRTAELGLRLALGARPVGVLLMVFRESLAPVLLGLAAGLVAVFTVSRLVAGLLFGVGASDPLTLAEAVAVLVMVAALAVFFPAWRASRVDPMVALRHE